MKTRQGFVSNSSSSSFIIAFKNDVCSHCGRQDDIKAMFNAGGYSESSLTILDTVDKVVDKLKDCVYDENEELKELQITAKNHSDAGYTIAYASVDHNESGLEYTITHSPTVKVIWGNGE